MSVRVPTNTVSAHSAKSLGVPGAHEHAYDVLGVSATSPHAARKPATNSRSVVMPVRRRWLRGGSPTCGASARTRARTGHQRSLGVRRAGCGRRTRPRRRRRRSAARSGPGPWPSPGRDQSQTPSGKVASRVAHSASVNGTSRKSNAAGSSGVSWQATLSLASGPPASWRGVESRVCRTWSSSTSQTWASSPTTQRSVTSAGRSATTFSASGRSDSSASTAASQRVHGGQRLVGPAGVADQRRRAEPHHPVVGVALVGQQPLLGPERVGVVVGDAGVRARRG